MFQRHQTAALFGFYSLVSLALLAWSADTAVRTLKHTVYYLLSPVSAPFLSQMDQWGGFGRNMSRLIRADQKDRGYERKWTQQRLDEKRMDAVERENERLTRLLSLSRWPHHRAVAARVWARDSGDWFHSVLAKPADAGVDIANPVVTVEDDRLVILGQVVEKLPDGLARVLLLTDPLSAISAHVGRTREQGLVEGRGANRLVMNYLFSDSDIRPGDEILTSGLGEIFPEGILIGRVLAVQEASRGNFKRATLLPAATPNSLREMLILVPEAPPSARPAPTEAAP